MIKVCFIILHYRTYKETKKCVQSIKELDPSGMKVSILIVDNGSPNDSGERLQQDYVDDPQVRLVRLKKGHGFSRGNNCGYVSATQKDNYDYYIFANNDLIFVQPNFLSRMKDIFDKEQCVILCPDILAYHRHEHQSPISLERLSLRDAYISVDKFSGFLNAFESGRLPDDRKIKLDYWLMQHRFLRFVRMKYRKTVGKIRDIFFPDEKYACRHEDILPMGACLIYSATYFNCYRLPFYPETYFYSEENILTYNCEKAGFKVLYTPEISVWHEDSASTFNQFSDYAKAGKFVFTNQVSSLKVYISLLESTVPTDSVTIIDDVRNSFLAGSDG